MSSESEDYNSRSSDEDFSDYEPVVKLKQDRNKSSRHQNKSPKKYFHNDDSLDEKLIESNPDYQSQEEEFQQVGGVFNPEIETILWKKENQYLIKYKNHSYLHLNWIKEQDMLESSKGIKNKLSRFLKNYDPSKFDEEDQIDYFDPTFVEIDRIIYSTEMFPIIHQKKANEMKGKWCEMACLVINKLINFQREGISYGIYFMQPVDPERDNVQNYRYFCKKKNHHSSNGLRDYFEQTLLRLLSLLLTILVFLQDRDDLGYVFKNCRKFNRKPNQDIRILCDTLREASIFLYKQWYQIQHEKYLSILQEIQQYENQQNNQDNIQENQEDPNQIIQNYNQSKQEEEQNQHDQINIINEKTSKTFQQKLLIDQINQQQQYEQMVQNQDLFKPEAFSFSWLETPEDPVLEQYEFLEESDKAQLDLKVEVDKLYFVKWQNLSYLESTWEKESVLSSPDKIQEFKMFNRSIDKDSRKLIQEQAKRHLILYDLQQNPQKKQKISLAYLNEMKNKLFYNSIVEKNQVVYTQKTQPVYKDKRLLRDYQLQSLNWLISIYHKQKNVILADEMGLGKTIQTIAFLNHLINFENQRGPFLIVAPLSTLGHWKRTVKDWTNLNGVLYYDSSSIEGRDSLRYYEWLHTDISIKGSVLPAKDVYKFHILITSYEVFIQDCQTVLATIPFQYIVVDEAHRLKNQNAKILLQLKQMICSRILLLTGTPIQNNTEELWTLLNFIEPQVFPNLKTFQQQFGNLTTQEQLDSLHHQIKPYLLRRMKDDVEDSIPPLQETIIDIEMTTVQKTYYRALYERNKNLLTRDNSNNNFMTSLNNLEIQLRKICNHPFLIQEFEQQITKNCINQDDYNNQIIQNSGKMIFLGKFLPKMKEENKKVLVFSQFVNMLNIIEDYLKFNNFKYERLDGTVKSRDRQTSIDRFNNPEMKRDVFLLSTKAGGIGINLTAANVVVIFDSDWNPQNDVQATARAHRIGQTQDVQVFRLITAKTYEFQMFERSSKKLGLDQAIFMGGAFQNQEINDSSKKLSKEEIEILLKKGVMGFIEDDGTKEQEFKENDIEQILQKNSRIAKYSVVGGTYSISKGSFVSNMSDTNINIDDPNFWQQILKNQVTDAEKLLEETKVNVYKNHREQTIFMEKLSDFVAQCVQAKLKIEGYSTEEEKTILFLCQFVQGTKYFDKVMQQQQNYKDIAFQWQIDIERPSRRFKKISVQELYQNGNKIKQKDEDMFEEEQNNGSLDSIDDNQIRLSKYEKQDILKRLCCICDSPNCNLICQSYCKQTFHYACLNIQPENQNQEENKINYFTCENCSNNIGICFKCKAKDTIGVFLLIKTNILKCGTSKCFKYYHPECLKGIKDVHYIDKNRNKFRCSLHYCKLCSIKDETKQLYQCLYCPDAYHAKCLQTSNFKRVSKKLIICSTHENKLTKIKQMIEEKKGKKEEKNIKKEKFIFNYRLVISSDMEVGDIKIAKKSHKKDKEKKEAKPDVDQKYQIQEKLKKVQKVNKYDYKQLHIESPDNFDYQNHQLDWCRYCGARYSSNFTKGPWGPRTLCTIHYIEWNQKKKLNLNQYKVKPVFQDLPVNPICQKENTELNYLNNMKIKDPNFDASQLFHEYQKQKKVKLNEE